MILDWGEFFLDFLEMWDLVERVEVEGFLES
jgi:hypothetical protein